MGFYLCLGSANWELNVLKAVRSHLYSIASFGHGQPESDGMACYVNSYCEIILE